MPSESEVNQAIANSLGDWGVKPASRPGHSKFAQLARNKALEYAFGCGPVRCAEPGPANRDSFPKTYELAIQHVLRTEIEEECEYSYTFIHDLVENDPYSNPPYRSWRDKNGNTRHVLNPEFSKCTADQLDPLIRFETINTSKMGYFFDTFTDNGYLAGMSFEAIVACHAIHKEACFHCKLRNSVRWTGGVSGAWQDLVCNQCYSIYEIKSKENNQKVEQVFQYKKIKGGSFRIFQEHLRAAKAARDGRKQYIVLVSRTDSVTLSGERYWEVDIAEIDYLLPNLTPNSFLHKGRATFSMASIIHIKEFSRRKWMKVPYSMCDFKKIARKVFEETFPQKWDALSKDGTEGNCQIRRNSKPDLLAEDDNFIQDVEKDIERLKEELASLAVGGSDDEWDDLYESD